MSEPYSEWNAEKQLVAHKNRVDFYNERDIWFCLVGKKITLLRSGEVVQDNKM